MYSPKLHSALLALIKTRNHSLIELVLHNCRLTELTNSPFTKATATLVLVLYMTQDDGTKWYFTISITSGLS